MTPAARRRKFREELLAGYADRQTDREARRAEFRRKYQFWLPREKRKPEGRRAG